MTKNIDFQIKVNSKQLDLTKISFKDFDKIIKQAKIDLQALPLNDPRYKILSSEIKTADTAWKNARKSVTDFNDENEKGAEKVKSYSQQIRQETKELVSLEQQFGKNSAQYTAQQEKIKGLRDAQEELTRGTQKLDDALSNIPGPIGQVGQGMQQLEQISQSAQSALKSLGLGFNTLGQAIKTSGVGAIVILIGMLVAALMDAAKKSQPLQDAFAAIGDAVGALFDALKPLTDFLINVFVKVVEVAASALSGLASIFGGVSNGFKKQSLELERTINRDKAILDNYGTFINDYYKKLLDIQIKYAEKRKSINDDDKLSSEQKIRELGRLSLLEEADKNIAEKERERNLELHKANIEKINKDNAAKGLDNARKENILTLENQKDLDSQIEDQNRKASTARQHEMKVLMDNLKMIRATGTEEEKKAARETLDLLQKSFLEEYKIQSKSNGIKHAQEESSNAELNKIKRQAYREDISLIKERSLAVIQLGTELIKEENKRNLKAAQDALLILKEQHRKELEEAQLAGVTLKGLKEKQAAEDRVAQEKIRLAKIQLNSYEIQLEIDKQNRIATEVGIGTEEYFKAKQEQINKGFEQEYLLADGDFNKQQNARTNHWKAILDLDKEKLQVRLDLHQKEAESLYENSQAYFNKQRDLENDRFDLEQKTYQGNYAMLEASKKAHNKNLENIDIAQLQYASDYFTRRAETEKKQYGQMYMDLRLAEEMAYEAKKKAAGDNATELENIEREHLKRLKDIRNEEIQSYAGVATAMLDAAANLTNAFAAIYEADATNSKKSLEDRKKAFETNKKYQIATASLSAASGIIQILTQPSTLPSPFDWIVKIANAAALGIMTAVQISKIKSTQFDSGGGSGGGSEYNGLGRNYGDGGMIEGPRHSRGGVPITAEGGEAIMTRGAVTAFAPMLSLMNQMGGGVPFNKNVIGSATYDNPNTLNISQDKNQVIMKTYVVESELTSSQQKQGRLKNLSTI